MSAKSQATSVSRERGGGLVQEQDVGVVEQGARRSRRSAAARERAMTAGARGSMPLKPRRARALRRATRMRRWISRAGRAALAQKRFSATVIQGNSVSSWKTVPTPSRGRECGSDKSTSLPAIRTMPRVGSEDAAEELDHRALAGAVFADQRVHLAEVGAAKDASCERVHATEDREMRIPSIAGLSGSALTRHGARDGRRRSRPTPWARRLLRHTSACRGRLAGQRRLDADGHRGLRAGVGEVGEEAVGQASGRRSRRPSPYCRVTAGNGMVILFFGVLP